MDFTADCQKQYHKLYSKIQEFYFQNATTLDVSADASADRLMAPPLLNISAIYLYDLGIF